jgi:hypothetical protein
MMVWSRLKGEVMKDAEIERLATRIVEKLIEPCNRQTLASAIAKELRLLSIEQGSEVAKLGEGLDRKFY